MALGLPWGRLCVYAGLLVAERWQLQCQYQTCIRPATALLVIVLGPRPANRCCLCVEHEDRAKELARQLQADAYRVVPFYPFRESVD
jgi:hypothetical protein